MKLLKFGLITTALLFAFSVTSSYAQPGKARYGGNQGKHKGWERGNHDGWDRGRKTGWQGNYRHGRISDRERDRLRRQRERIFNSRNRYYRDGYLNNNERRKLTKKVTKYRRNVYRDRRDWN